MTPTDFKAPSIFNYLDYRDFMTDWTQSRKSVKSGPASQIARAAGCQPPLISLVLKKKSHLTAEQGEKLLSLFGLAGDQADYFMHLLHYGRAGTTGLRKYHKQKLDRLRDESLNLQKRLEVPKNSAPHFDEQARVTYYTHWIYLALHMALGVPELQRTDRLAQILGVEENSVKQAIDFLLEAKIVEKTSDGYRVRETSFHLPKDSYLSGPFRRAMAQFALRLSEKTLVDEDVLNYSAFLRLSRDDFYTVRDILAKAIDRSLKIVQSSGDEEVVFLQMNAVPLREIKPT